MLDNRNGISLPPINAALRAFVYLVVSMTACGAPGAASASSIDLQTDATLNAIASPTPDCIRIVGDRGTLLSSNNGGRTWSVRTLGDSTSLYAIAFEDDKIGWAVGGEISAYSHRSRGVVLRTTDGGENWQSIPVAELPRLTGIQSFGGGHLIAWGDWSSSYQSGLLQSLDGGVSWAPIELSATHIRCAAWLNPSVGVVVDRLSRVWLFSSEKKPKLLTIAGNPSCPIKQAAINEHGWWLVGNAGQVLHSIEGKKWETLALPGTPADHQLISIEAIALAGEETWLGGRPGNVVWHSKNAGETWDVIEIPGRFPIRFINANGKAGVIAGGTASSVLATRNSGQGWWPVYGSISRLAVYNLASETDTIAWDALGYASMESRRSVGASVVHLKSVHELTDVFPDISARVEVSGRILEAAEMEAMTDFPVGDLSSGRRINDLIGYAEVNTHNVSDVERAIIQRIRMFRPDVLIVDAELEGDSLSRSFSESVRNARRLASQSSFRCFSSSARIPEVIWNVPRALERKARFIADDESHQRKNDISYGPLTAMKSSGRLLGELINSIGYRIDDAWQSVPATGFYADYSPSFGFKKTTTKDTLFTDLANDRESIRPISAMRQASYQAMIARSRYGLLMTRLWEMEYGRSSVDSRWSSAVQTWLRNVPSQDRSAALWELAEGYRQRGKSSCCRACLNLIFGESPSEGVGEQAALSLLLNASSEEIAVAEASLRPELSPNDDVIVSESASRSLSSPFLSRVTPAAFVEAEHTQIRDPFDESIRLRDRLQQLNPWLKNDPRWLLLSLSLDRRASLSNKIEAAAIDRLVSIRGSYSMEWIADQESYLAATKKSNPKNAMQKTSPSTIPMIARSSERPRLDGNLDEPFWEWATKLDLRSTWSDENMAATFVRILYDEEFLYLGGELPHRITATQSQPAKSDLFRLRIDTDRDYLTWFELGIDSNEKVTEMCNGIPGWKPRWYVKTRHSDQAWFVEAAIPLAELTKKSSVGEIWGWSFHREIGGVGTQNIRPNFSDRFSHASFVPMQFAE
jgi:photosystem II stability/assembly factor-like uncharacterized protein